MSEQLHLVIAAVALAIAFAVSSFTVNRLVKRKLRLSIFLLVGYLVAHAALLFRGDLTPAFDGELNNFARLALAAALINLFVICLINPLREDRVPDRYPAIVQDAFVIGLVLLVATFAFDDKFLTTGAVSAVVLGFALQDTLGNAFAGLAIQSEKPFNIGHWVKIGEFEGRVAEVTWRATKVRTKDGNFVIVPNNIVSKEAITNYSEPAAPTRMQVEVGVSYAAAPNMVKQVMMDAVENCSFILTAPAPSVLLLSFDASAITYRLRFWIDDYEEADRARDQARTSIYYAFNRHNIEIPYPIQVEYTRDWPQTGDNLEIPERERLLAGVDIFAALSPEQRQTIAMRSRTATYAAGEAIVRQGHPGYSMFVLHSGSAVVRVHAAGKENEVAQLAAGGYFGEMSLLTGQPRTASVVAAADTVVLEINADLFRQLAAENPAAIEQVAVAAATRRAELEQVRATAQSNVVVEAPATMLSRMRKFLRL